MSCCMSVVATVQVTGVLMMTGVVDRCVQVKGVIVDRWVVEN